MVVGDDPSLLGGAASPRAVCLALVTVEKCPIAAGFADRGVSRPNPLKWLGSSFSAGIATTAQRPRRDRDMSIAPPPIHSIF